MRSKCYEKDDYIKFVAKLFDPNDTGFVKGSQFESLIHALFTSEVTEGQDSGEGTAKVASFAEHLLEHCAKIGVYKVNGFFKLEAMKTAFHDGVLEIDTFLQALK